jgi:hypothetical protein
MKKSVTICPVCGSLHLTSVYLAGPQRLSIPGSKKLTEQMRSETVLAPLIGWSPINPSVFVCDECDYFGICPEIDVAIIDDFRKHVQKSKKI